MPTRAKKICVRVTGGSSTPRVFTLSIEGKFDRSTGFALWQYCRLDEERYSGYVLNLARVCDLHESGLTWLRAFVGWAKVFGAWVCLINVRPKHARRCIGIPVVPYVDVLASLTSRNYNTVAVLTRGRPMASNSNITRVPAASWVSV